jgi:hypothetical protein
MAALAAAAGGRPPLHPGMAIPGMMPPGVTAAQYAAAAQAKLQAAINRKVQFPPIVRPTSEDERSFVPKQRLQVRSGGCQRAAFSASQGLSAPCLRVMWACST